MERLYLTTYFLISIFFTSPLLAHGCECDINEQDKKIIKVGEWDGGGIRGLGSLYLAQAVEKRMGGKKLVEEFDYFAGTSTGGIISLQLANGASLSDVIELYEKNGAKIFNKSGSATWRWIKSFFTEIYSNEGLIKQLKRTLGKETTFGDLKKGVIVTSYDIEGNNPEKIMKPYIFNSKKEEFETVKLWEAGVATSSAPTFFEPFYGFKGKSLIDGGVIANHPGEVAIAEISSLYSNKREEIEEHISMLSFGTGIFSTPISRAKSRNMGLLETATYLAEWTIQGVSQITDTNLKKTLGDRYVRLNPLLKEEIPLDGTSPKQIKALQTIALNYIKNHPKEIDLAAKLMLR